MSNTDDGVYRTGGGVSNTNHGVSDTNDGGRSAASGFPEGEDALVAGEWAGTFEVSTGGAYDFEFDLEVAPLPRTTGDCSQAKS